MFCRFCGTNLPADSSFCHSCGKSLTTTTSSASTPTSGAAVAPALGATPAQPQQKSNGMRLGFLLGVLLVLGIVWWVVSQSNSRPRIAGQADWVGSSVPAPQPRTLELANTAFTLNAGQGRHWTFAIPAKATAVRVEGTFSASGGARNDVEVYLMSEDQYVNWQNAHDVSTYYSSGRMTQGTLDVTLPSGAGTYYLVFTNKFSFLSPKAVQAAIRLHYTL